MGIVTLLFSCFGFLDVTSAMIGQITQGASAHGAIAQGTNATPPHLVEGFFFPERNRVFVQNRHGKVFRGLLTYIRGRPIPPWVEDPTQINEGEVKVYILMPNSDKLVATINEIQQTLDINDPIYGITRCFILYGDNIILEAVLSVKELPRKKSNIPRVAVRVPEVTEKGESILIRQFGEFQPFGGYRPQWLKY
ncbi:uncharacterized protein LOC117176518 [Belonocnema kinseyi]|uniref:uncharacterized protein LOC117176518 n=1 Tax=Belonocnema kinseyi TaxID=2817044 RepID=UPI00143DE282|nr:uncharacterized protein LOC117176518 [Belonocnema kinseyi]